MGGGGSVRGKGEGACSAVGNSGVFTGGSDWLVAGGWSVRLQAKDVAARAKTLRRMRDRFFIHALRMKVDIRCSRNKDYTIFEAL